jgi:hypothetical protein
MIETRAYVARVRNHIYKGMWTSVCGWTAESIMFLDHYYYVCVLVLISDRFLVCLVSFFLLFTGDPEGRKLIRSYGWKNGKMLDRQMKCC